jgi:hypothetical protein
MNANEEEGWRSKIDSLQALSQIEKERSKKALIEIEEILGNSITSYVEQNVFGLNHAPWIVGKGSR